MFGEIDTVQVEVKFFELYGQTLSFEMRTSAIGSMKRDSWLAMQNIKCKIKQNIIFNSNIFEGMFFRSFSQR